MNLQTSYQVGSTFQIEKFTEDGTITHQGEEFHNEVLDCGLSALFGNPLSNMLNYINLGSSNTPVDVSQTGLLDRKFSTNELFNNNDWTAAENFPIPYGERGRTFQFNIGTCTGTFREIGLSKDNNANYFNRQLIKDGDGNPMDLVVAADEGLRITVKGRIYLDPSIKLFSEIWELDLKNNTSGSITFNDGYKDTTRTYAELTGPSRTYYLKKLAQTPTRGCYAGEEYYVNNKIKICGPYNNTESLNLSIKSHTMLEEPTITKLQEFTPLQVKICSINDETSGTTTEIQYYEHPYSNGNNIAGAFQDSGSYESDKWAVGIGHSYGVNIVDRGLAWLNIGVTTVGEPFYTSYYGFVSPSSQSTIHSASVAEPWWIGKSYYSPGALGTGNRTITGFAIYQDVFYYGITHIFKLLTPIIIEDTYEFEVQLRLNFGRYTP